MNQKPLEKLALRWDLSTENSLIPVVLQHFETKQVLFVAFMNQQAWQESLRKKRVVLYSRSRKTIWLKGETSGNFLQIISAFVNCEQNSLLLFVQPLGTGVCHTTNQQGEHRATCYYRQLNLDDQSLTDCS